MTAACGHGPFARGPRPRSRRASVPCATSRPAHPACLLPDLPSPPTTSAARRKSTGLRGRRRGPCRPAPGARGGSASSSAEDAWAPGCLTPETGSPRSGLPSLAHPPQGTPSATPRAMSSLLCSVPSAGRGLLSLHGQHRAPSRGPSQKKRSHSRALTHSSPVPGTLWGLPGSGRGRR